MYYVMIGLESFNTVLTLFFSIIRLWARKGVHIAISYVHTTLFLQNITSFQLLLLKQLTFQGRKILIYGHYMCRKIMCSKIDIIMFLEIH